MNKPGIFLSGFGAGCVVIVGLLFWHASHHLGNRHLHNPAPVENAVLARLPFDGQWFIGWGGETKELNQHFGIRPQNLALDIAKVVPGTEHRYQGDSKLNESYLCWAQPIYSPIAGTVVVAVDGIPDNVPGDMNPHMASGNCLMIHSDHGFVVVLCHLKLGSVTKKKGDVVEVGAMVGRCGNSGNASEPHLHIHIQSEVGFVKGEALRPLFREITVNERRLRDYSPIKGDLVSN